MVGSRGRYVKGEGQDVYIESFTLTLKARDLIVASPLRLFQGRRYGLIGRNGIGKTTLLQQIHNRGIKGNVFFDNFCCTLNCKILNLMQKLGFPKHLTTLLVQQEVKGTKQGAIDLVVASDQRRATLVAEQERLEDAMATDPENEEANAARTERLVEIYALLEEMNADAVLPKAKALLSGLGFTARMQVPYYSTLTPNTKVASRKNQLNNYREDGECVCLWHAHSSNRRISCC